ncbi:MAG: hypothetical protein AAGA20_15325 [Planctomycetota bacterium]
MASSRASAPLLIAAALAIPAGPSANAQDRDWAILTLPAEEEGAAAGTPVPLLDGRHVELVPRQRRLDPTLGPLLPGRTAEDIVWRSLQGVEGGTATVEPLGDAVLVRGPAAARDQARGAIAALEADLAALHFDVRATLVATEGEDPIAPVFDDVRRVRTGSIVAFGQRSRSSFVADFGVEVASEMAIADPMIGSAVTGETLHLWVSSRLSSGGVRELFVQGYLDLARLVRVDEFEPDVYELGTIEQPVVVGTQVLFGGRVTADEPLVVELDGLGGDRPTRRLAITAVPREGVGTAPRIVDLGRGLWRERVGETHVLLGSVAPPAATPSPTPTSLTQLYFASFAQERGSRPILGEALVITEDEGLANALRGLAAELERGEGDSSLTLAGPDGFRARVPAPPGALVRVARTVETTRVVDYDPQIANDAALSDPKVTTVSTGFVVEGVDRGGAFVGRGVRATADVDRIRDASPVDVGRIQLGVRATAPFPLRLESGEASAPGAGLEVRWDAAERAESPR